jgi:hypothetical protein
MKVLLNLTSTMHPLLTFLLLLELNLCEKLMQYLNRLLHRLLLLGSAMLRFRNLPTNDMQYL